MALTWAFRCASWGFVSSLLAAVSSSQCFYAETHVALRVLAGVAAILLMVSSLIAFHISSLRCSESHTLWSLLLSYKWHEGERLATSFIMARANRMWKHPREAQENLLRELTRRHADTEYGRRHSLAKIQSLEDLRKKHPLATYDHYKEYIQRLADGDEGIFLDEKPERFCFTSGTTGIGKLIPYGGLFREGNKYAKTLNSLAVYRGRSRPSSVQKRCFLYTYPRFLVTKGGFRIAPYAYFSEKDTIAFAEHSSPPPALFISDEPTATYVHLLFAIADPNLALLASMFTPQLYRALKVLETKWQMMLGDLSTGKISDEIPLSSELRQSIQAYMTPISGRVCQLRREFEKGFQGILRRIWPHLVALEAIDIMGKGKNIHDNFGKDVPVVSVKYGGTEPGIIAINMWVNEEDPRYVLLPHMAAYEFIPEEQSDNEDPQTLLIDEVEVGGRYELVLTTRTGLFRYLIGDIIKVVGFHDRCPVIRMHYRKGDHLNIYGEKTNTRVMDDALNATLESWPGLRLVDWTSAESPLCGPGTSDLFYILFVEVDSNEKEPNVTEEQRSKFDENLQHAYGYYERVRMSHILSQAQVHFVRPGTFTELRNNTVARTTASFNQFKTPRKLRTREQIEWMMARVVEAKVE